MHKWIPDGTSRPVNHYDVIAVINGGQMSCVQGWDLEVESFRDFKVKNVKKSKKMAYLFFGSHFLFIL